MAVIVNAMNDINNFFNKHGDPRSKDLPLMSSPFYTIGLSLAYVYIVKVIGPNYMRNREAFSLRKIMIVYNLFQVLFNVWLFHKAVSAMYLGYYFKCQPLDRSETHINLTSVSVSWWYFFSKIVDFLDTIFFVMRKKFNQVSTLHVIHHGIMPSTAWICCKVAPVGHATFGGFINIFVHIIMYFYYMLSAFGPKFQKYLWWKKYITWLQLFQFVSAMFHILSGLNSDCFHPRGMLWFQLSLAIMFLFLFSDFYKQSYIKRKSSKVEANSDHKNGYVKTKKDGNSYTTEFQEVLSKVRRRSEG